jgi:hypothetical protein
MDDWMRSVKRPGKEWMLYVQLGVLGIIGLAVAIAYALSRFAPNSN